jgi:hypothetical protein
MSGRPEGGQLAAAISDTVVKTLTSVTGRGPLQAKTTPGDNGVFDPDLAVEVFVLGPELD